jgi:tetratricopeptide (TPR) repeat protein
MIDNNPAVSQLEKVVTRSPGSPAFARLADIYRSQGQVDKAIALCENGVKANPIYPTGHLLLGRCYFEMERVDEALVEFETVLKLDWKNLFAIKIMGDIHAQKGQREKAAHFYKKASDIEPQNVTVRDMFRRFEKYLSVVSETLAESPVESPAETIARTIEESPVVSPPPPVDFMDETPSVSEPARENIEVEMINVPTESTPSDDFELPSQPEAEILTEEIEIEHAPINRNIDEFNDPEPETASNDTEMVDLPPEMTGQREECVGEFKAQKSALNRIHDEQSALLDALPQEAVAAPVIEEEVPTAPPEISTSAAGMDGYYSLDGGDSESGDANAAVLNDLDNIELENVISDETEDGSTLVIEEKEHDPLKELMLDIDADDSVKDFLAATASDEEENEEVKPEPVQPVNESGISSSAAGMEGYYNVSGSDAIEEGIDILQDIDTVELSDALTETETETEEKVELGLDIELPSIPELTIKEPLKEEEKKEKPAKKSVKKKVEKIKKPSVKVVSNVATMSLADIYLRQGHKEQALTVFKKLLKQDPANQDLKDRIQTLKEDLENNQETQQ